MNHLTPLALILLAVPASAAAQSSNTSSNSSSNNGVVRERVVDTYCDNGLCTRTVERSVYRDGSNGSRDAGERRFLNWALRNFDANGDGRLNRREYRRARSYYQR